MQVNVQTVQNNTARDARPFTHYLTVILLTWVFFAHMAFGSRQLSMTSDEPPHIVNGYVALTTTDTWTVPAHGHPPLLNAWAAWPVLLQAERPEAQSVPYWNKNFIKFVRAMWPRLGPIERLAFATRVPIMLLACVLMALVYRWACDRFGHWGGLLAIGVMAWEPTLIAHAQLNTTDLGTALFIFACVYLFKRYSQRPSWQRLVGMGGLLGVTMAAKGSGIILAPVIVALMGCGYLRATWPEWRRLMGKNKQGEHAGEGEHARKGEHIGSPLRMDKQGEHAGEGEHARKGEHAGEGEHIGSPLRLAGVFVVLAVGLLVLWAVYRFEWRALPDFAWPLPLASHARMLQIIFAEKGRLSFLWGQRQFGGWWWYFPFAFAIKTPIPLLIGLAASLVALVQSYKRAAWDEWVLWFFPVLYVATSIQSGLNIGYRHLLPAFPFVFVSMGRLIRWLRPPHPTRWTHAAGWLAAGLGLWYMAETLSVYPFALAYFNQFVGGPTQGYHYLVDSNIDWGQSFKALKKYLDQTGDRPVWISYYTWIDPSVYGINTKPLYPAPDMLPVMQRRYDPAPGTYAIGATPLQGVMLNDPDLYEWFRHRRPVAQPGYGLLVYEVAPHDPPARWIAQCNTPAAALSNEAIENGFGRSDLRQVYFDCTQSWVWPEGGSSSGWYSFFRETWLSGGDFLRTQLGPARLSYEQVEFHWEPAFALFEWSGQTKPTTTWDKTQARVATPGWLPPQVEAETDALPTPLVMDGPLAFLGYRVVQRPPQKVIEVWTAWWQTQAAPARPFSIMAHLVGADGVPIAVGDGLGMPSDQLQAGDVILQRHQLTLPDAVPAGSYWIQSGVYWLDNLERWTIQAPGQVAGDHLLLDRLEIGP